MQEEIYDETDRIERQEARVARWATKKWKRFVENKKRGRSEMGQKEIAISMESVVVDAMEQAQHHRPSEETSLLGGGESNQAGIFSFLGDVFKK